MARAPRIQYPGAFYHIFNRGVEKRKIFTDEIDYRVFLQRLLLLTQRLNFLVHCYCLMPNHFHLYVETPDANISKILYFLLKGFSLFFNRKHQRVGPLFQGRYQSILVDQDSYSLQLCRYIHLNPVRARLVSDPKDYQWSSYKDYAGGKHGEKNGFLTTGWILSQFDQGDLSKARRIFDRFTAMEIAKVEHWKPEDSLINGILGDKRFAQRVFQSAKV